MLEVQEEVPQVLKVNIVAALKSGTQAGHAYLGT